MKEKIIIFIFGLVVLLVSYKSAKFFLHNVLQNVPIAVHVDGTFLPAKQQAIEHFCKTHFLPLSSNWIAQLKKQEPLVSRVISTREGAGILIIVEAAVLIAHINDRLVVDTQGVVYPADQVNKSVLSDLKRIGMSTCADAQKTEFKTFIQKVPACIMDNYAITWQSPYVIYLTPTQVGSVCVIRYDDIPTQKRLQLGEQLLQEAKIKNKKEYVVDFRFADQIILTKKSF